MDNVLRTAIALITMLIFSGLGTYGYSFKRRQFDMFPITTIYTVFIISLFSVLYVRDIYNDIDSGNFDVNNISKLYSYMNILAGIACYMTHLRFSRRHVRFLNLGQDRLIEVISFLGDGEMYNMEVVKVTIKALLIPILLQITLIVRALHFEPNRNLLWTLYTLIPYAIRTAPATSVYGILLLITAFMKTINSRIQTIVDQVNHMHTHREWLLKTPYQRMQHYCELSDKVDDLNDIYTKILEVTEEFLDFSSITWLNSILCNVVGIMLGFFTQYKAIADTFFNGKEYDFYSVVTDSAYMFISFMEIYTQSEVASNSVEEIRQTGVVLQRADTIDADIRLRQAIEVFSLRILQKNFKIKPLGLFEVDVSLVHGVFSTATGFLLILIQSDLSKRFLQ